MDAAEADAVLALAAPRIGERALDAGCGTGIYTRRLLAAGATVTGVDCDPEMLTAASVKAPSATLVNGDVAALPFADGVFDLTLAVTLLCFAQDPHGAVDELVRVTRPGGRVVLAELGRFSLWAAYRRVKGWLGSDVWMDAHFYSPGQLAALLRDANVQEVQTRSAAYLPPRAPAGLHARRARGLGVVGAAFSLARGEVR
jgi:ubiquinone/menaquinone biosynthesis C-methylase UbiE